MRVAHAINNIYKLISFWINSIYQPAHRQHFRNCCVDGLPNWPYPHRPLLTDTVPPPSVCMSYQFFGRLTELMFSSRFHFYCCHWECLRINPSVIAWLLCFPQALLFLFIRFHSLWGAIFIIIIIIFVIQSIGLIGLIQCTYVQRLLWPANIALHVGMHDWLVCITEV